VTKLPDWLVERAALGEVPEASTQRLASADPEQLADRIATLHAENQAELAAYPAGPAVAQIEAQVAKARERRTTRRRRIAGTFAAMAGAATIALVVMFVSRSAVEVGARARRSTCTATPATTSTSSTTTRSCGSATFSSSATPRARTPTA
jgi:hypothetical protein